MAISTLHITDIHGDVSVVNAAAEHCKANNIDALCITGDFAGHNHDRDAKNLNDWESQYLSELEEYNKVNRTKIEADQRQLLDFMKEHDIKTGEDLKGLTSEDMEALKKYSDSLEEYRRYVSYELPANVFKRSIEPMLSPLESIVQNGTQVYGVGGNHDLNILYPVMGSVGVKFADMPDVPSLTLKGSAGEEYVVKGIGNTYEIPNSPLDFQKHIDPSLYINYATGYRVEELDEEDKKAVASAHDTERQRLGSDGADIMLAHKGREVSKFGCSEVAAEYMDKSTVTHAGHNHGTYIGFINGKLQITAGTGRFVQVDYADDKSITEISVYRLIPY